jgi:hypothetical protein
MSAVNFLLIEPCVRFASMTDQQLHREYRKCNEEIATATRWGDSVAQFDQARDLIEAELRRRRITFVKASRDQVPPYVVDDPGVENDPQRVATDHQGDDGPRPYAIPVITGSAKASAEWKPSWLLLALTTGFALLCLEAAVALAGQRVLDIEASYAAEALV